MQNRPRGKFFRPTYQPVKTIHQHFDVYYHWYHYIRLSKANLTMYELCSPGHYNVPFLVDKHSGLTPIVCQD